MIDASHGNSQKDYKKQPVVARDVARQVALGSRSVFGLMLESFLVEGRQDLKNPNDLVYGQSITDACLSWDSTAPLLHELAIAVQGRRKLAAAE
jgi:3-deoxy-7-phosphoheptulonate synthase